MLKHLVFLIHPFCYAHVRSGEESHPFARREQVCAQRWAQRVKTMGEHEAIVVIHTHARGHAATDKFIAKARQSLGPRCAVIDTPAYSSGEYWDTLTQHADESVREAFRHQDQMWSAEELHQDLHVRACVDCLRRQFIEHHLEIDPGAVTAQAWGESFEGCVTKYSLELRRRLGLSQPIGINFDMTVPDAVFLLDARLRECIDVNDGVRLFLFTSGGRHVALYVANTHAITDQPRRMRVAIDPGRVRVISKQAQTLAGQPWDEDRRGDSSQHARRDGNGIVVAVNMGFMYRAAKSPAFLVADALMDEGEFKDALVRATDA